MDKRVPEVRFKGFTDDWEQRRFGDVFTQSINYINPSNENIELWSLTVEKGLTPKSNRYNRKFLVKKNDKFKLVESNDFIYNPMNITLGAIDVNLTGKRVAVSGYYVTMKTHEKYNLIFLSELLKTSNSIKLYKRYATGTLLEKQRVQFPTLSIIKAMMPHPNEQKKIGDLLKKLNFLIDLQQDQLNLYIKLKQGFLQKLFPTNGKVTPRIRFIDFGYDWHLRKLKEEFTRVNERNDGSFGRSKWISVSKMYFQSPDKVQSNNLLTRTYVMRKGDIAFEGHPNKEFKFGRFVANDIGDGIVSELFPIYRHIRKYDNNYWKNAIHMERVMEPVFAKSITSSGNSSNKLYSKHFLKQTILIPDFNEQRVIGLFLEEIDKYIDLQQEHLQKLNSLKKYYLQKLFI